MYYIHLNNLESDTSLACLVWRVVKDMRVDDIGIVTPNSKEKMTIEYTSGGVTAQLEINVVKHLQLNGEKYNIGFLDDNYFLYQADRSGIDEAYQ